MEVVRSTSDMKERAREWSRQGIPVALVPTMGALHEGHLALVRAAREHADTVVVSIFVNPIQFGPQEDLARYPRDLERDLGLLEPLGVTHVFAPEAREMYWSGFETRVVLERLPEHLCGLSRPGHFAGVATVVLKLFHLCKPTVAVFGLKDYQQVLVIERMVRDLDLDVRIVRHPTVREPDGLAMSSRNAYLTPEERRAAPELYATLRWMRDQARAGALDAAHLIRAGRERLERSGFAVEYLDIVDAHTLDSVSHLHCPCLVTVAARLGTTRLIDNVVIVSEDEYHPCGGVQPTIKGARPQGPEEDSP